MFHSSALQAAQDQHLAGQIVGRGVPVTGPGIFVPADQMTVSVAHHNQVMLNRRLPDAAGLGPAGFMGIAEQMIVGVPGLNSLSSGIDGLDQARFKVV